MGWIQITMLAIECLIKYGPKLYSMMKEIYDWVEKRFKDKTREEKAEAWNNKAEMAWRSTKGYAPSYAMLNVAREKVCKIKEPNQERKPLRDFRFVVA